MRERAAQYGDWEQHRIRCGACGFEFPVRRRVTQLADPIPCPRCKKPGTSPFAPVTVTVTEDKLQFDGLAPSAVPWAADAALASRGLLEEHHEGTVVPSGLIEHAAALDTMTPVASPPPIEQTPVATIPQPIEQTGALDPAPTPPFRAPPVPPMFGDEPAEQQGKGNRRTRRDG